MEYVIALIIMLIADFFITAGAYAALVWLAAFLGLTLPISWGVCFVVWLIAKLIKIIIG
ncbi:MAG: hypothetical protein IKB70_08295 [Bacilli bacterium]|nr:hypothetical protein [Bacilli bacterium]